MHCNMQGHSLDESYVQRCCHVWWTVYILDRQITSFMGVPLAIRDEDITAALPKPSQYLPNALALTLNVKLSRIISQILISKFLISSLAARITNTFSLLSCLWRGWPVEQEICIKYEICFEKHRCRHKPVTGVVPASEEWIIGGNIPAVSLPSSSSPSGMLFRVYTAFLNRKKNS